jgi:seryl-tRNA(Sec) selenium transferase
VTIRAVGRSDEELSSALRRQSPPIICRVQEGNVLVDPRTVAPSEEAEFLAAVKCALAGK